MAKRGNEGKRFEQDFLASFKGLPDVSIDRFYDVWGVRKHIANKSDFVAYRFPNQFYFECKSYSGDYIPISALSHQQYSGLLSKSKIRGVIAGVMLNYRLSDSCETYFLDIRQVESLRLAGVGGVNLWTASQMGLRVESILKRTRYRYGVISMLETLSRGGETDGEIENAQE